MEYLLASAVISLVIHCTIIYVGRLDINFELLFRVLSGQMTEQYINSIKEKLSHYFHQFVIYIFWVNVGAVIIGWLSSKFVRSRRIRRHPKVQKIRSNGPPGSSTRYFNKWWYYFRFYEYSSQYQYLGESPNTLINVLVETKDACVLYEGTLFDWVAEGEVLDRIYIKEPTKRLFYKKGDDDEIKLLEGDKIEIKSDSDGILCIPYSKIANMHISLVSTAVRVESPSSSPTPDTEATIQAISELSEEDLPAIEPPTSEDPFEPNTAPEQ